jgi:hypothetical protein
MQMEMIHFLPSLAANVKHQFIPPKPLLLGHSFGGID